MSNASEENNFYQALIVVGEISINNIKNTLQKYYDLEDASLNIIAPEENLSVSVEQIRSVINESFKKNISGKIQIFIFTEVNRIKDVGQNALLKILEEPPLNIKFVLMTNDLRKILPTVISRCRVVKIKDLLSSVNVYDEEFLIKKITSDKKDIDSKLVWKDELLDNFELKYFTSKLSGGIDEVKLSKLWLFDKWISE